MSKKRSKPGTSKPKVVKQDRPIPPDDCLPGRDGVLWTTAPKSAVIIGCDPADTSGWSVVSSGPTGARLIGSGAVSISEPGGIEQVIDTGIRCASDRKVPLVLVSEHSKAPYRGGGFGVDGFIGMIRCQGTWIRTYDVAMKVAWARDGIRAGRKQVCLPGRRTLVVSNDWRTAVFGSTKYKDPETGKTYSFQRTHWKHIAVRTVTDLIPGLEPTDDQAEAILIGFWGSRFARI